MDKSYPEQLVNMLITWVAAAVTKPEEGKRGWIYQTSQSDFPGLWGMIVGILPKESRVVSEEEYDNDDTMAEGVEGDDGGVWMDGEDELPDDLRWNV